MTNAPAIVTKIFQDFDAFTEDVEYADLRFTITRLETPLWERTSISLPGGMHIQVASEGCGDITQGCTPGHGYIIVVLKGHHFVANGVQMPPGDLRLLTAWTDLMCPYRGDEEIRAIPDPTLSEIEKLPIRPRVKTAPFIDRFNIQQDVVPGRDRGAAAKTARVQEEDK